MNELTYAFNDNLVRIVEKNGESWFLAKDIAAILGYRDAPNLIRSLDDDESSTHIMSRTDSKGGNPNVTLISEGGLYHAIFLSRKAEAKDFRKWVTNEVLPQIRKNGYYLSAPAQTERLRAEQKKIMAIESLLQTETAALEKLEQLQEKGLIPPEDFASVVTEFLQRGRNMEKLPKLHGKDIEDDARILSFVSEKIEVTGGRDHYMLFDELFSDFCDFCNSENPMPQLRFRHRMETLFSEIEYSHKYIDGFPQAIYYGIREKQTVFLPAGGINTGKEANR